MMRTALAVLFGFGVAAGTAEACDCGRAESAAAQLEGAAVAFVGTAARTVNSDEEGSSTVYTVFTVKEVLKGDPGKPGEEVYIFHPRIEGMNCGLDFEDGKDVLVFAYAETVDASFETNQCSMPQFPEDEIRAAAKPKTKGAP